MSRTFLYRATTDGDILGGLHCGFCRQPGRQAGRQTGNAGAFLVRLYGGRAGGQADGWTDGPTHRCVSGAFVCAARSATVFKNSVICWCVVDAFSTYNCKKRAKLNPCLYNVFFETLTVDASGPYESYFPLYFLSILVILSFILVFCNIFSIFIFGIFDIF